MLRVRGTLLGRGAREVFIKNSARGDTSWKVVKYLQSISKSHCSRPQVSAHLPSLFPQLHLSDALPWGPWTPSQASKQKLMPGSAGHCFGVEDSLLPLRLGRSQWQRQSQVCERHLLIPVFIHSLLNSLAHSVLRLQFRHCASRDPRH